VPAGNPLTSRLGSLTFVPHRPNTAIASMIFIFFPRRPTDVQVRVRRPGEHHHHSGVAHDCGKSSGFGIEGPKLNTATQRSFTRPYPSDREPCPAVSEYSDRLGYTPTRSYRDEALSGSPDDLFPRRSPQPSRTRGLKRLGITNCTDSKFRNSRPCCTPANI